MQTITEDSYTVCINHKNHSGFTNKIEWFAPIENGNKAEINDFVKLNQTILNREFDYFIISGKSVFAPKIISIFEKDFKHLSRIFILLNENELKDYLSSNVDLFPFLNQMRNELNKYYPGEQFFIELVEDAEFSNWKTVFVKYKSNEDFEKVYPKIKEFKRNWLYKQDKKIEPKGHIHNRALIVCFNG